MTRRERGEIKPIQKSSGETVAVAKTTMFLPGTNGVWKPNPFLPTLLSPVSPLIDKFDDQYSNTLVLGEGDSDKPNRCSHQVFH